MINKIIPHVPKEHMKNIGYECKVVNCTRPAKLKEYCHKHYKQCLRGREMVVVSTRTKYVKYVYADLTQNEKAYKKNFVEITKRLGTPSVKELLRKENTLHLENVEIRKSLGIYLPIS